MTQSFVESTVLYAQCTSDDAAQQADGFRNLWAFLYPAALHVVRDQVDASELAQDCTQDALVRIHKRLDECGEARAFRTWAKRIVANICIDELRRRNRLQRLDEESNGYQTTAEPGAIESPEAVVVAWDQEESIRQGLRRSPISERSFRVVVGRYLDDVPDEALAERESQDSHQTVLPSHIQVTRSRNLSKLRKWEHLETFLGND
ncbi:MAG: sigma-70 family RNA polymerase sigma factor [Chloroflexota bacterium]